MNPIMGRGTLKFKSITMARAFVKNWKVIKIVANEYIDSELPIEWATTIDNVDILKNYEIVDWNISEVQPIWFDPNYLIPNN